MITCPNCGKRNPNDNKFCGDCGTDLSEAEMYCPNCGKMHNNGEKFCTECGTKLVTGIEYNTLERERIRAVREKKNNQIIELSHSLDDFTVMLLADHLSFGYRWVHDSKEKILNNILNHYDYYEIIAMSKDLPKDERYRVFKLFNELDEESARKFAKHYLSINSPEKMSREDIFEHMLRNYDMKKLRIKLMSYNSVYK